ncbi:MAG: hypothetical protein LBD48_07100 [Treponema sp.]|nr:hypothetical protein [Treponema sp.]
MKKLLSAGICFISLLFSCTSVPETPVEHKPNNTAFERTHHINIDFMKRGVLFNVNFNNDNNISPFWKALMKNSITFYFDGKQPETSRLTKNDEHFNVTVNNQLNQFGFEGRHVLLIASVYALGLLETGEIAPNEAEKRFYSVISRYAEKGYPIEDLLKHNWYTKRQFKISGNSVTVL